MVIAIIGILAAIALPSYQTYIYRAKAADVIVVLDKLHTVMGAFQADTGSVNGQYHVYSPHDIATGGTALMYGECKDGTQLGPAKELPGMTRDDLMLTKLGVRVGVGSCTFGAEKPGQYQVLVVPIHHSDTQARQVALAVAHTMQGQAYKANIASNGIVSLFFQI